MLTDQGILGTLRTIPVQTPRGSCIPRCATLRNAVDSYDADVDAEVAGDADRPHEVYGGYLAEAAGKENGETDQETDPPGNGFCHSFFYQTANL